MELKASEIATLIDGKLEGDGDPLITSIKGIDHADETSITFVHNPKYRKYLSATKAAAIIISQEETAHLPGQAYIRVSNPYLAFTSLLEAFERLTKVEKIGIENPVFQHETATVGLQTYLGAFSYIGEQSSIGDYTKIYPQVYIGDQVRIGQHCIIYPGVKIYPGTTIGDYCIIHSGAIIGSDGFGFAPQSDGSYRKIPQIGKVAIEDHVEIGANTVVDCGTFDETIIRRGVKLDNLIQVAHNVQIGEDTVIAAQTGISGSTIIGNRCAIGGQVGIGGHLEVADNTQAAAKSGITKDTTTGQTLAGMYAFNRKDHARSYVVYRRLPEVLDRIESLEKKLQELRNPQISG